jgi:hypothetical protein
MGFGRERERALTERVFMRMRECSAGGLLIRFVSFSTFLVSAGCAGVYIVGGVNWDLWLVR